MNYNDDDDEEPGNSLKEGDLIDPVSSPPPSEEAEEELKLPVREKKDEDDSKSFFSAVAAQKSNKTSKKARSPQYKNMFQKISWKHGAENESPKPAQEPNGNTKHDSSRNSESEDESHDGEASVLIAKRKLELEEAHAAESIVKKSKTGTPISSS